MYQICIEGIREVVKEVVKEAWKIYESTDKSVNWFQKLAESEFKLLSEGPAVFQLNILQAKLEEIEQKQQQSQQLEDNHNQIISRQI